MRWVHPQRLGQDADIRNDTHNVEDKCLWRNSALLLPHDASQVFIGQFEKALQLGDPLFTDLTCRMSCLCLVKKALRFFLVRPRHVKGVFQRCLVLECPVMFHGTSLAPFPG